MSDDEEVLDPKTIAEKDCRPKCALPWNTYQECVKRIAGDKTGEKHCTGWYFDFLKCVDKCAAPKMFVGTK